MRIIGFNLTKILAERQEEDGQGIRVDQNIDIKDIKEEKIPITNNKALKIKFTLTVTYSKDFGKIELEGSIMTLPDTEEFKSIMDSWKDKKIPENMRLGIFNFIMVKCNVKALYLEDEMNMPLHVPMPRLTKEVQKKE
ncbi:hypothetical protein CMI43_03100 [Candidatus Pacearchaeota archaeon]|nr:hypothetical protein [Candidatus Pacearchaeota archaeon]|tara:strand:- start:1531 stop:1944 length:414 start_codon:yes stop_codon:yes gene_type:complete